MAGLDDTLNALMTIDGAQAVALVDYESGMLLGEAGSGWTWKWRRQATPR